MEEILASIRRIIEDSDQTQPPVSAPKAVANDHGVISAGEEAAEKTAALSSASRAFPERLASGSRPAGFVPGGNPREDRLERMPRAESRVAEPADDAIAPNAPRKEVIPDPAEAQPPKAEVEKVEAAQAAVPKSEPHPEPRKPADKEIPAPGTLVSEAAGRQVAAAFEELSAAVEDTRRRGFEKMAQDMMRPMLQEWLNKNLPAMVERLVREEIRRVSGAETVSPPTRK